MKTLTTVLILASLAAPNARAGSPDYQSKHLAIALSPARPAFACFAVDSLGQGKLAQNPVLAETNAPAMAGLELKDRFTYTLNSKPIWRVRCGERTLTLRSDYAGGAEAPPFLLEFNQKANHATLLGLMKPGERRMSLPCVLHLPDMGSLRISANNSAERLDYEARRSVPTPFVSISFPAATALRKQVEYQLEVAAIYPKLPGIDKDPRYDGFRRDYLNIFQVNPRVQMLANNASSDPCSFTLFEYSELALRAPALCQGLTCLDLVRMTLDRYLSGAKGYGQVGYACAPDRCRPHPLEDALDLIRHLAFIPDLSLQLR